MTLECQPDPGDPAGARLLRILSGESIRPPSFRELARRARMQGTALRRLMGRLSHEGYRFERRENGGVVLNQRPDVLTGAEISSGLATRWMGKRLSAFKRIGSTNETALDLARRDAPEGTVVCAETQTRGRGRLGRVWLGVPGKSLAFSVILRPGIRTDEFAVLTLAAAAAVAEALENSGFRCEIRWPNDILIGGRKVCGILTEMQAEQDRMGFAVVGIGLNVHQRPADFPESFRSQATSLRCHRDGPLSRARLLQEILWSLEHLYEWVKKREMHRVLDAWRARSAVLGRQVKVTQEGRTFFGEALHVDEKGGLWVRNDLGMVERLTAGEIRYLRLSGARRAPSPGSKMGSRRRRGRAGGKGDE